MDDTGQALYTLFNAAWAHYDDIPWDDLSPEDKQKWRDIALTFIQEQISKFVSP